MALLYLLCALIALALTSGADGIAAVWPASGVFVAGLILYRGRAQQVLIAGVALASMVTNVWSGTGIWSAVAYTIANLAEGGIAMALMRLMGIRQRTFAEPVGIAIFALAAVIAGVASAGMAGLLSGNLEIPFLQSWATTVTLGMLTVTPTIMFLVGSERGAAGTAWTRHLWTLPVTALVSVITFGQQEMPLLFLPILAISIATIFQGLSGAAIAIAIVAATGSIFTAIDRGPVSLFFGSVEEQVLFFQFYLVGLIASVLPLAALLSRHTRNLARLEQTHRLLEAAERLARMGHWRHSLADGTTFWSVEAARIAGFEPASAPDLFGSVASYHPQDRDRVAGLLQLAAREGLPFKFEARIVDADGRTRHVSNRGQVETGPDGRVIALFGTLMEKTERAVSAGNGGPISYATLIS